MYGTRWAGRQLARREEAAPSALHRRLAHAQAEVALQVVPAEVRHRRALPALPAGVVVRRAALRRRHDSARLVRGRQRGVLRQHFRRRVDVALSLLLRFRRLGRARARCRQRRERVCIREGDALLEAALALQCRRCLSEQRLLRHRQRHGVQARALPALRHEHDAQTDHREVSAPAERVRDDVVLAWDVLQLVVELRHLLDPARQATAEVRHRLVVLERVVVRQQQERLRAVQVVPPVQARLEERHELLLAHIVVALGVRHLGAEEGDRLQTVAVVLLQRGADGELARVGVEHERLRLVRHQQHGRRAERRLERLERRLLLCAPREACAVDFLASAPSAAARCGCSPSRSGGRSWPGQGRSAHR